MGRSGGQRPVPDRSTARLSYLQAVLKNLCRKPPVKAIQAALDDLGYLDYLKKQGEGGYQLEMWSQHIGVARSIAQGCPDLPAFLARLEELPRLLLEANGRTDCPLCLSTVHSAKGREFDRVLLADLIEGVFPASAAIEEEKLGDGEAMEEEARIFYVAITRPGGSWSCTRPAARGRWIWRIPGSSSRCGTGCSPRPSGEPPPSSGRGWGSGIAASAGGW